MIVALTGCKHTPPPVTPLGAPGTPGGGNAGRGARPPGGSGPALQTAPAVGSESVPGGTPTTGFPQGTHDGWLEDATMLSGDTVHFEYDRSEVRSGEQPKVAAVADYLKSNPAKAVKIEGHCDERGTEEYNRALGERRALALREALISLGVEAGRADTVSFGKDRPVDPGHDAAAWEKNRRGVFIVLSPPK
jgi:peptidoglycan-associated lipoprotein